MKTITTTMLACLLACNMSTAHADTGQQAEQAEQAQQVPAEAVLPAITVYGRHTDDTVKAIPQSINVYDQQNFELAGANSVGDVLVVTPGASRSGSGRDMFSDNYLIRGFDSELSINGLGFQRSEHPADLANVERLEVLKGPASVLYGEMQPGGTVNIVTKQPLDYFQAEASAEYGSFDHHRTTLDVTGPLNDRVRARLNLAYQDSNASLDYWGYRRVFAAPTVAIDLSEQTELTIEGSYSGNEWTALPGGLPEVGTVLPNPNGHFRPSRNSAWKDSKTERNSSYINTRLTHALTDNLDVRLSHAYTRNEGDWHEYAPLGLAADQRTLSRAIFSGVDTRRTDHEVILDVRGELNTGVITHKFVAGVNYRESDMDRPTQLHMTGGSLDLYNPVNPGMILDATTLARDRGFDQNDRVLAGFFQNRMTVGQRWHLLAGLRYTDSDQSQTLTDYLAGTPPVKNSLSESAWTSQFGLVHDLSDSTAIYLSRGESFVPQHGTTSGLQPLDAEESVQYEAGVRVTAGGLQIDAARFVITKNNIGISDPLDPNFRVAKGKARSQGGELTVSGYVQRDLYLSLGYGYTDTEVLRSDNAALEGKRFANVPLHTAALQARYHLPQVRGLSLGGTATYAAARPGDNSNSFSLPSYTRVDLAAYYAVNDHLQIDLLAQNISGEEIYSPASFSGVVREEGRAWLARVKYFF